MCINPIRSIHYNLSPNLINLSLIFPKDQGKGLKSELKSQREIHDQFRHMKTLYEKHHQYPWKEENLMKLLEHTEKVLTN